MDVAREVGKVLGRSFGERMEPAGFFSVLEGKAELAGRKSGRGFYLYKGDSPVPNRALWSPSVKGVRPASDEDRSDIVHRYMDSLRAEQVRDSLLLYAERFGPSYAPARMVEELAASGRSFYGNSTVARPSE